MMKVVIADASCLILLTNLKRLDILEKIYGHIWITQEVLEEYGLPIPAFVSVHEPADLGRRDVLLLVLDPGEASSIALAVENPGCQIIIDEKKGRQVARALGLDVIGTLRVLTEAARMKLIKADIDLVRELDRLGFRLSNDLKAEFLSDS